MPPRWAEWFVALAAGAREREHVVGDLREEFVARAESEGDAEARRWYRGQVARSLVHLLHARWLARHDSRRYPRPERHMESLKSNLTYAARSLLRRPAFAIVAVLTLALGIGTATAIFTVVDGVLLRPLPFPHGEQLVTIWQTDTTWRRQVTLRERWDRLWFTYPQFQQWSAQQRSLSSVALFGDQEMALTGAGEPTQVAVSTTTPGLMTVLGTRVAIGRWFLPGEVGTNTERLAVLSHELWASRFGADSTVVGRSVTLDDKPYRVVGVLPDGFALRGVANGRASSAAVWIPLGSDGGGQDFDSSYEGIGRLNANVPLHVASTEIDRLQRATTGKLERGARLVPRLEAETGAARRPLVLLSAGVGLLLLMACVNVAMLLLGEAPARELELATRRALGASSRRIVRQLLTESAVLAAIGGVCGVALAFVGVRFLVAAAPPGLPRVDDIEISMRTLLFSLVAAAGTSLAFGLAPAVSAVRGDASDSLRARSGQRGHRQKRLHGVAIGLQVAMALVLLVGATVLTRSLRNLAAVDPGIRDDRILTVSITAPSARYGSPSAVVQYFDGIEAKIAALPGVRGVGVTSSLPFSGRNQTTSIEVEGGQPGDAKPNVQRRSVRAGFFAVMGIPLLAGRAFEATEAPTSDAIIVDETMAQRLWPNESALGKRVKVFGGMATVVGIVGSIHHSRLDEPPRPTFYIPHQRQSVRQMTLVIATTGDPLALSEDVRRALWSVDGSVPIASMETMSSRVARSMANEAYRTGLLDIFGVAAALLTGVGVFGLTARAVSHRRRELAIRVALGARPGALARAVLSEQSVAVLLGVLAGLGASAALAPLLRNFAFGASATDLTTLSIATTGLLATSVAAAIPAIRAALRIDAGAVVRDA